MNKSKLSKRREAILSCLLASLHLLLLPIFLILLHHLFLPNHLLGKKISRLHSLTCLPARSLNFKISSCNVPFLLHFASLSTQRMKIIFSSLFHTSETHSSSGHMILSSIINILFIKITLLSKPFLSIYMKITSMRWNMKTKSDISNKWIQQPLMLKLFKSSQHLLILIKNPNVSYSVMRRPGGTSDSSTVLGRKLTSASPFVIVHPHVCPLAKNYCYPRT